MAIGCAVHRKEKYSCLFRFFHVPVIVPTGHLHIKYKNRFVWPWSDFVFSSTGSGSVMKKIWVSTIGGRETFSRFGGFNFGLDVICADRVKSKSRVYCLNSSYPPQSRPSVIPNTVFRARMNFFFHGKYPFFRQKNVFVVGSAPCARSKARGIMRYAKRRFVFVFFLFPLLTTENVLSSLLGRRNDSHNFLVLLLGFDVEFRDMN